LATALEQVPGTQTLTVAGASYDLIVGLRENKRKITSNWKAFTILKRIVGMKALIDLVTIPLREAVDKYIPLDQHRLILKQERTGPREVTAVLRQPSKAA